MCGSEPRPQPLADLRRGRSADEPCSIGPALVEQKGPDGGHRMRGRDTRCAVRVHLDDLESPGMLDGELLHDRGDRAARSASGGRRSSDIESSGERPSITPFAAAVR